MGLSAPQTPKRSPALPSSEPPSLTCHGACPGTTRPHRWPGRAGPPRGRCMPWSGRWGAWRAPGPSPAAGSPSSHAGPGTQPGSPSTARPPGGDRGNTRQVFAAGGSPCRKTSCSGSSRTLSNPLPTPDPTLSLEGNSNCSTLLPRALQPGLRPLCAVSGPTQRGQTKPQGSDNTGPSAGFIEENTCSLRLSDA